ncbi:MAG: hypothetical protein JWN82_632 [Candidatus Saccharibacteria bacterium]|nr:hypothetical protein [Candidatus Saccharibacteria bacterium]
MMRRLRSSAGDTIVEVLIAMAVASAVLGGAYAVVNHTLANSRQAQEHAEALKIAQGQVERISALATTNLVGLTSPTTKFHCVKIDGSLANLGAISQLPAADTDTNYTTGCRNLGSVNYRTAFQYVASADPVKSYFKVYVNWPSAAGNGEDQVTLVYKVIR